VWKGQQLNKDSMVEGGAYYALNGGIKPSGRTTEWNCEAHTITISSGGNSCGFVRFNTEKFWCGGDCFALKKLSSAVSGSYLFHYLKSQQHRIMTLRTGSGIPHVYRSDIEAFPISLPDIATQTAIARYLNTLREELDLLNQSVSELKTQKRGLMQKLLTGQWRLNTENLNSTDPAQEITHG
jgi:type I restriction enzyme S subunit